MILFVASTSAAPSQRDAADGTNPDTRIFATGLSPAITKADLKRLPVFARHSGFFENFVENVPALRLMVWELAAWLREVMDYERSITIIRI